MSTKRPSIMKRDREMRLRDKARAKEERRVARRAEKQTRRDEGIVGPAMGEAPGTDTDTATPIAAPGTDAPPAAVASTAAPAKIG